MSSNSWASQRKFSIIIMLFVVVALAVTIPTYFKYFNDKPTCTDNKMNGDEEGIDCGGICLNICPASAAAPIVHFSRAFRVQNGTYNIEALIENINPSYIGLNASYSFKLYDKDNILVAERDGNTTLLPHKLFPLFEPGVDAGNKVPAKVVFKFEHIGTWQRSNYTEPSIQVINQSLSTSTAPRLDADINNQTLNAISRVEAVAMLYDERGNVIASSRTYTPSIGPDGTAHIIFTWPQPFSSEIAKIEIFTQILPDAREK